MNIYVYDIMDGDKGIIFAKTEEDAKRIFKQNYDNPIADGDYDSGICDISYLGKYDGGEKLIYMYN